LHFVRRNNYNAAPQQFRNTLAMSVFEKQVQLTRTLFQINSTALREFSQIQRQNIGKYVELNKNYGQQLPALKSVADLFWLQREYSNMIWNGIKVSGNSQRQLLRDALQETGTALKTAYIPARDPNNIA